jgi:16S rRNA (guanine527-N7)-methyltransferase
VDDPRLERWLRQVVATPGLTSIDDLEEARRVLLDDALRGAEVVGSFGGPIVDVGSGGGSPGIPLAAALPQREIVLLEANRRKCAFLREISVGLPNVSVLEGRAEEQETERYGVAVAKALAQPPVAAEWCLPLVGVGGAAVLWLGPSADLDAVGHASELVGGGAPELRQGLVVLPKIAPTPQGFPRRPGVAKKRPLA